MSRRRRNRFLALVVTMLSLAASCGGSGGGEARVIVPSGASLRVAADSLARNRVVGSALAFRVYAKLLRRDRGIRAGTYLFKRGTSWSELLDDLNGGKVSERRITIPEGWSLQQIVPQLARVLSVPVDSVEAAVRDTALLHALDVPTATLEGYLFPDTYVFADGTTPAAAVRMMVDRFQRVWQPAWDAQLQKSAMSRNDVMALAAIVEKEARLPEERPVIAAVYMNRIKAGMPLQADPTVQYALGKHVSRVMYKDLEIVSPYNTYRNKGLPPGPIASPGKPAIVAALFPANVPYRFFVAFPDGHHQFTTDFAALGVGVMAARRLWDSVGVLRRDSGRTAPGALLVAGAASSTPPAAARPAPRR